MNPDEYARHDATALAALVAGGAVTAEEVLDAALARADQWNPVVNALVSTCPERARRQAAATTGDGPLAGVPFLVKDAGVDVAGLPTTYCSRLFADAVASTDHPYVTAVEKAGAVVFGRTAVPEFTGSASTEPGFTGPTRNPWNPARSAGGSSGGAAAAVAAGIVPAAHGADSGGSLRIPAACTGLFTLKPGRGVQDEGPPSDFGITNGHVLSWTVRDSALFLDVTADSGGSRFRDAARDASPGRLRIGLLLDPPLPTPVDAEYVRAVADTARLCESLGHDVDVTDWPANLPGPSVTSTIHQAQTARQVTRRLAELGRGLREDDVDLLTRQSLEAAAARSIEDFADAVDALYAATAVMAGFMTGHDVLLTPTLPGPPPAIGEMDPNGDLVTTRQLAGRMLACTYLFNITGQPAVSLPLAVAADGMPIGVQFAAASGGEELLFALSAQLEAAAPWVGRRPTR